MTRNERYRITLKAIDLALHAAKPRLPVRHQSALDVLLYGRVLKELPTNRSVPQWRGMR